LFGPYDIALRFSVTLVFTVALFILIGFRISLQGYRPARYYSMAWAVFLGGMIIYGLKAFGVLPTNFWTTWVTQFGSVWQAVILAFAITDRFYLHEEERRERQDRYTAGLLRYNDALNARVEESDEEVRAKNRRLQEQAETLRIAERKADAANRAKSEFLANMSHEIRTPMNAIIGFLHLLGNSRLNATQRGYVDKAERAARALMQLIHDLLDFSKIDVGRLELQSAPFDVGAVVRDAYDLVALGAGEKGLDLRLQQDGVDGCWVAGDAGRLQQVLVNLLHNAIKFTAAGEVCFEAASAPDADGRVRLRFAISDTGIGIGADEQQRLFKPFTQADASITRRFGGTGLGLSISQQLVQQMGGTIDVESTAGVGSRFSFMLRLPAAAAEPQRVPLCESRDVAPLTGMSVLVVEDQPLNQEVVAALLEESGVMPLLVASGQDAIARLRSGERVEAVLMDLQMPHMDGYETVRHIRAIPGCGDLPIIAMTAHASVAERQRCHAAGFAAHLAKPVDHQALCAVLRQVRAPMAAGATASGTDPARADRPASGVSASAPPEANEQPLAADALGPGLTAPEADRAGHVERLQRFADRFGEHPALIRGRLEAGDRAAAMSAAHALAGVALSLGIPQVGIAAKRLEQSADQDGATLRAAVAALEAAMGTALDSITRLVPAVADAGAVNPEPLDQASLRQALQQLTTLLGARNLRARAELEMLLARTREPRLRRRLSPVADAVRRFDFAAAGEGVAALLAELDDADEPWG
jgi:signal transduction histidine kinase/CheY-like chemotaxis protein